MCWNVKGLQNKLCNDDFMHYCTGFDIIALTETWAKSINDFNIAFEDYRANTKYRPKIKKYGRYLGGIAVFVKNNFVNGVTKISTNFEHGIF